MTETPYDGNAADIETFDDNDLDRPMAGDQAEAGRDAQAPLGTGTGETEDTEAPDPVRSDVEGGVE